MINCCRPIPLFCKGGCQGDTPCPSYWGRGWSSWTWGRHGIHSRQSVLSSEASPSTRWSRGNLKSRDFYSSQVSKPRPENQNDCTTLDSAQDRATLSTVRGCTLSLTPRWSSLTRRAPRYPNHYEHKWYTVGEGGVTRVCILFVSLSNHEQMEIMGDPLLAVSIIWRNRLLPCS